MPIYYPCVTVLYTLREPRVLNSNYVTTVLNSMFLLYEIQLLYSI